MHVSKSQLQPPWIPADIIEGLAELKGRLRTMYGDRFLEIRLFGSYARGDANKESDIDVLLLFDCDLSWHEQRSIFDTVTTINVSHQMSIAPLILSRPCFRSMLEEQHAIAEDIEAEGISI